jgi:tellurite resistance protein TerC
MDVPLWAWLGVVAVILAMLAVDLLAHRRAHVVSVREAATWSLLWVGLGVAFGVLVWQVYGAELAGQYFAGYVIEKSLAVDNVFVFAIIFSYFAVPRQYQHRVLFYGVLGALVLRAAFIAAGSVAIASFSWVLYLFGAFLVLTGLRMARHRNEHADPETSVVLRVVRRVVPTTDEYHGQRFWVRLAGRWVATPLFVVLVLVEVTDIVFAVDSIPAIFAVTQEPFLVFTSNAFAILGLRALYFLLADLIHRFVYLKLGLSVVLVWVGVKMLLLDVYKIPTLTSLAVVAAVLTASVVASLWVTRGQDKKHPDGQHPDEQSTGPRHPAATEVTADAQPLEAPATARPDDADRSPTDEPTLVPSTGLADQQHHRSTARRAGESSTPSAHRTEGA